MPAGVQSLSEREIFLAALEKDNAAERAAFIEAACGSNRALRERIEELLREQEQLGDFLETPALHETTQVAAAAAQSVPAATEQAGDRIGRYKLLQNIGEGGCGVVYMAEQEEPVRRRVALKIIKLGMDTRSVIARFEVERQALAMMDHPNIAKVFDGGATDTGRPYFVMELVRGVKITDYCDENNLSTQQRLDLFIDVCNAIQHAHQKGVIHRDIKPSNILVTLHDSKPVPKVIDFGIAKAIEQRLTDKTLFTQFAAFIGTPTYMSPEQAEMSGLDMDTRSDVYSLGVLLYELLTGKTPFDAEMLMSSTIEQCRRTIREDEPPRPSTRLARMSRPELTTTASRRRSEAPTLISSLRGDLDWIVMKCIEKDRTRRYATVHDLSTDVENYLHGAPVTARPPTTAYRLRKLYSRHKATVLTTGLVAVTIIAGAGLSLWQAIRATDAEHKALTLQVQESRLRRQAETEKSAARINEYVADMNLAHQAVRDGNFRRAVQLLDKHKPQGNEPDLRGFEWRYLRQLCQGNARIELPPEDAPVNSVAMSPDGDWVAVALRDRIDIFDPQRKLPVNSLTNGSSAVAFMPDGKSLIGLSSRSSTLRVWDTSNWLLKLAVGTNFGFGPTGGPGPGGGGPGPVFDRFRERGMTLTRDGSRVAGITREGVTIWRTSDWQPVRTISEASGPLTFSPDGTKLAAGSSNGIVVWSLESGAKFLLPESTNVFGPFPNNHALTFSPDGRYILSARNTLSEHGVFIINIWDTQTGELTYMPEDAEHIEHTGSIRALLFSPDGNTLASASADHSIRLWDFAKRQRISTLQGHLNEVTALAFSRDGQQLVSGAKDGAVHLWPVHQEAADDVLPGSWSPLTFTKDGRRFAAVNNREGILGFFDTKTHDLEQQFQLETGRFGPRGFALSANGHVLAHGLGDGHVRLWQTATHHSTDIKLSDGRIDVVAISPDATILITGGPNWSLRWWELGPVGRESVEPHERKVSLEGRVVQFSPDGSTLAEFHRNGIQLWNLTTVTIRTNLAMEIGPGFVLAFSPDGRLIATSEGFGDTEYSIRVWDTRNARLVGVFTGHKQSIASIAFSPDGKTLASSSDDSTLKFWNITTQQELLNIRRLGGPVRGLMFSPDGQMLVGRSLGALSFFHAPL